MALKDWKRHKDSGKGMITFTNKEGNILDVTGFHLNDRKRTIWEVEQKDDNVSKDFKTKSQALSYAKEYMRNN